MATASSYKFVKALPSNNSNISEASQGTEYRDVEVPQFKVGDHILWTPGGELLPKSLENPNFGVGIIHRIVHYISPKTSKEYLLAFIYFYEWVPDAVEVTWPDGDSYFRLLVQITDLRPLDQHEPQKQQTKKILTGNKSHNQSQEVVFRPCVLENTCKLLHPLIPENSIIFNLHNQRFVKGVILQLSTTSDGTLYIEADFELEIYQDELTHSQACDRSSFNCDHRIAVNVANLSQHLWNSEFKLMINNQRVKFEDLFIKSKPSSSPPPPYSAVDEAIRLPQDPPPVIRPPTQTPSHKVPLQAGQDMKPTQILSRESSSSKSPTLNSSPVLSDDRNKVSTVLSELRSKLPFRKKKTEKSEEKPPKNAISQYLNGVKTSKPIHDTTSGTIISSENLNLSKTHYVGEYYNDISETIESPPTVHQSEINIRSKSVSSNTPKIIKITSFSSKKTYPAPQPPSARTKPQTSPNISAVTQQHTHVPTTTIPTTQRQNLPPPPPPPPPLAHLEPSSIAASSKPLPPPGRSALLEQIRLGKSLKHVEPNEGRNGGCASSAKNEMKTSQKNGDNDFASIIMGALANRRAMIDTDDSCSSDDGRECDHTSEHDDDAWD